MELQTLNWIITGIFTFFFALGGTWIFRLRGEITASQEARKAENEELRSEIRLREKAQEASAEQFRSLFTLISEQIAVGNKMAENFRMDAERRYEQEQQRHDLIRTFTGEQSKHTNAIETLGTQVGRFHEALNTQIGKVRDGITETAHDAKATTLMSIETNKQIERLIKGIDDLRKDVTAALDKVIRQPLADDIRNAVREAEINILAHIDTLTKEQKPIITEVKADEAIN